MFDSSNSERHAPPSSLTGGRFLTILAILLLAVISLDVIISRNLYDGNRQIAKVHERLVPIRQQIDTLYGHLSRFSNTVRPSRREGNQNPSVTAELDSLEAAGKSLVNAPSELSAQSASVQQAVEGLNSAGQQWSESNRESAALPPDTGRPAAIVQLEEALGALSRAVEQLDEANFSRLNDLQRIRLWKNVCVVLAWLLILLGFGYAARLDRHLRRAELARFRVESELAGERQALENRVQARTSALEAEVKERQRAERLNRGRNHTLEMLARNESTADILLVLANTVAEYRSTWLCLVHSLDSGSLKLEASSGLNDKLTRHFRSISADFSGAPESAALESRKPHVIVDLGAERKPWSELLRANGLLSVWSAPFLAPDDEPLGTLTVYALLKWEPSAGDIEMLEMACHMAALVLERSRLQAQLIDHAYHDSLTGLPNRRLGRDRLASAMSRSSRAECQLAVLWIDLDRFKQINDQHGHPVGDAVLQQAAQRLLARLRSCDTLARMGGDEFMVIMEGVWSRLEAETAATDLLDVLAVPMRVGDLGFSLTASIGVSLYPEDGKTVDSLAQHADQAMYAAKFGNGGVLSFAPDMDREPAERRELEAELSHALETGGFTLAYQPLCLPDGKLTGFEALLRFNSPRFGNVPPSHFIPIAEEAQLIVPIGEWVLREVCRQNREWLKAGYGLAPVAVNISASQFARDDFADAVEKILRENGQNGVTLVLELTESIVMHNFAESARQMKRLKRLGVRIAIDDFGTGYSSLSYLHRLPIDVLKIDRSFMENLNQPDGTLPIVDAVLSMAHTLGLMVVAEGVETIEQLATLRQSGCDIIQGYFFSKPVPPEIAATFLKARRVERRDEPVSVELPSLSKELPALSTTP